MTVRLMDLVLMDLALMDLVMIRVPFLRLVSCCRAYGTRGDPDAACSTALRSRERWQTVWSKFDPPRDRVAVPLWRRSNGDWPPIRRRRCGFDEEDLFVEPRWGIQLDLNRQFIPGH